MSALHLRDRQENDQQQAETDLVDYQLANTVADEVGAVLLLNRDEMNRVMEIVAAQVKAWRNTYSYSGIPY